MRLAHADDEIRKPRWAGSFYPAKASELLRVIDNFTKKVKKGSINIPANKHLRALIMPHAGYIYSGLTAAHASVVLRQNQFKKVILLGPDHRIGLKSGAISNVKAYETPLGLIPIHRHMDQLKVSHDLFRTIDPSNDMEHSLEVILPFLQRYLKKFELLPVILGNTNHKRVAEALLPLMDKKTILVASSDLSHYLSYDKAIKTDKETIEIILDQDVKRLMEKENCACGKMPILVTLHLARMGQWKPVLLHYSNSGDATLDHSRVVGYTAIAFFGDLEMKKNNQDLNKISQAQGESLIKLARITIMDKLGMKVEKSYLNSISPPVLADDLLQTKRGTFVTLNINGQLRGCIGNLTPRGTIVEGVKENAINAAFHDPRFNALSIKELDSVEIEVSILTEPKRLKYDTTEDLIKKLRVNVDGVIIRKGYANATFLPQVWEQLPKHQDFLSHLCQKAGLGSDEWKKSSLEVFTYQVQYFEEEK